MLGNGCIVLHGAKNNKKTRRPAWRKDFHHQKVFQP
jgi:hypothetical protein